MGQETVFPGEKWKFVEPVNRQTLANIAAVD